MIDQKTKAVVTVADMACMVGLSRARFYQLVGTAFPFPQYSIATRRPFFTEEQQILCLEVRRRNCGIDGKPIMFYARRWGSSPPSAPRRQLKVAQPKSDPHAELVDAVRLLGLTWATSAHIGSAIKLLFPNGVAGTDDGEIIRTIFVHLKRQNTGDNVGR